MILYHIEKWKYRQVWPPEGTLFAEGRWNVPGQWLIYPSPSIALAKLEVLANDSSLPIKRVCMTIKVSGKFDIYEVDSNKLNDNWVNKPYPHDLRKYTNSFLDSDCLLMKVPSAQSYRESNYLISVRHPLFHKQVKLIDVRPEPFDPRLG